MARRHFSPAGSRGKRNKAPCSEEQEQGSTYPPPQSFSGRPWAPAPSLKRLAHYEWAVVAVCSWMRRWHVPQDRQVGQCNRPL
ncbi:hypothetical protein NQZ68_018963 [Dissostichus eleginoides]|nr:hypothetical protein NQZ68_018963 [Dissostichus eleginoides]